MNIFYFLISKTPTDHGGPPGQRSPGAGIEVIHRKGAHEGKLHVGMRVYASCSNINMYMGLGQLD